jgi:hypothetical protein
LIAFSSNLVTEHILESQDLDEACTLHHPTSKMKVSTSTIMASLLAFINAGNAWTFDTPRQQFDGENNFGCTAIYVGKGEVIDYQVGIFSDCTLRVYNDANCDVQIGISSNDWTKKLTRPIFAFDVRDC